MPSINSDPKPRAISSTIEARKEVSVPKEEIKTMYSIEERIFLVLEYHRLQESPTATRRSFQARFNVPKGPDAKTIRTLFAKFQRTGCVTDDLVGNVGRKQTAVTL
ncbi:uncharacterized protein TNCV_4338441 [Trichonephila clavipes]|uniref:DUF4817 domain-containing protein n=1 Tax=Trichonephila clavipes TaxID=2585209 RepID=A0A8X6SSG4_TRICX|nr:uncharacterized protein TNCV_4338441 [Trichonephila clavipes]